MRVKLESGAVFEVKRLGEAVEHDGSLVLDEKGRVTFISVTDGVTTFMTSVLSLEIERELSAYPHRCTVCGGRAKGDANYCGNHSCK